MSVAEGVRDATCRPRFGYSTAIHRAHDPCSMSGQAAGWSHAYEQLLPGSFEAVTHETLLGPIQLGFESIGQAFGYRGRSWAGSRVFLSYLSDCGGAFYDGRPVLGGTIASHRWDAIDRVVCRSPTRLAVIAIDEAYLAEQIADYGSMSLGSVTFTTNPQQARVFQSCVIDILHELEQQPQMIDSPAARSEFRSRVLELLIGLFAVPTALSNRLPSPTTRAYVVQRAIEIMEREIAGDVSITDLCRSIRVSPRTLGYSFIEVTGVSPTQYLMSMRLNAARRDLSQRSNRLAVQAIAARWGFWHMGRFAKYYRLAFGELPSETAARASRTTRRA